MNYFEYNENTMNQKAEQKQVKNERPARRDLRNEHDANRELRDTIRFIARVRLS